jgi:hypothetical protein
MAPQFPRNVTVLLLDQEELTSTPFIVSIVEMPIDVIPLGLRVEPNIGRGNHGNRLKVIAVHDASNTERSP